jgi:phosphopantothenoylcysteine synthetase/decarboxylase
MYNPSLREEPREQLAEVIPLKQETSLLDWLETNNRLLARETFDDGYLDDEEEISELMGADDASFEDDDDDLDDDIDEE